MRSGKSVAKVPNCSAITIGEWFGNMMPPAPTRMVLVYPATWPANADRRGGAGDAGEIVVFGEPEALVSSGFGVSGQVRALCNASAGVNPSPI